MTATLPSRLLVLALAAACASDGDSAPAAAPEPARGAAPEPARAAAREPEPAPAPASRELEFLHHPIAALEPVEDGVLLVGLGPMARWFAIHPELSPDYDALVAFARAAHAAGRRVHATAWIRDRPSKAAPPRSGTPWPFVIVRLADVPDPRAGG